MVGNAPILPQPNDLSRTGYSARKMMNVTRKALRSTVCGVCPLRRSANRPARSGTFGGLFSEQPRGSEDQDHHQQREHDCLSPAWVPDAVCARGDQSDKHSAQEGALNVADAAHDGRREAVQAIPK